MAINNLVPNFGREGVDFDIQGDGFANATRVEINGVPCPMLVVNDNLIQASVPVGATSGKITVFDPDGNQVSPGDFTITGTTAATPPEQTSRGREALDTLILAMAQKARNDKLGVASAYSREVLLLADDDNLQGGAGFNSGGNILSVPTGPTVTPAQIDEYRNKLFTLLPKTFDLTKMVLTGDTALLFGFGTVHIPGFANDAECAYSIVMKRNSTGYQIISQSSRTR